MYRKTLLMTAAALVVAAPLSAQFKDNSGAEDTPPTAEESAASEMPASDEPGTVETAGADEEADAPAQETAETGETPVGGDTVETAGSEEDAMPAQTAEGGTASDGSSIGMVPKGVMISANAVEEAKIYSLSDDYDQTFWDSGENFGSVAAAWNEIGEVDDVVLDDGARVMGVTVDVGGFLGIGERTVLLPVADIRLVQMPEDAGFYIVTRMSRNQIEEARDIGELAGD